MIFSFSFPFLSSSSLLIYPSLLYLSLHSVSPIPTVSVYFIFFIRVVADKSKSKSKSTVKTNVYQKLIAFKKNDFVLKVTVW